MPSPKPISAAQVTAFLLEQTAALLDMETTEISPDRDLSSYGLDSADAVLLSGALEELLDIEVDATIVLRNRTVAGVVEDLRKAGMLPA